MKHTEGVQPILTPSDLQVTEDIIRKDPEVQRQCELSGVPKILCIKFIVMLGPLVMMKDGVLQEDYNKL